jgi:short-subunit dehydrogenase
MELSGANVLLTGASGGIGQAIAHALAREGASLKLSARRAEVLDGLCAELEGRAEAIRADLADRDSVPALIEGARDVDVLVANAALPASGRIEAFTPEEIDRALEVNLRAPMQLSRALVPGMVERGRGHLVFISSMSGKVASPGSGIYSATKFGLRGFASGLRQDLHGTGVGVTTVFPGFIRDAGMFAEAGVELPRGLGSRTPGDVAGAVIRGIARNRGEIDVAPLSLRGGALLAAISPGASAASQRRLGGVDLSEQISEAQAGKR